MTYKKHLILKAKRFYENKNFYEAKISLLGVLEDSQIDSTLKLNLYILLSDICFKINEFENAENFLLKCIEQGKTSPEIFNSLGNIYSKKRDYKNSEKFYKKSIEFNQNNDVALTNLAILYHNLGQENKATTFYKNILKRNPENIGILYNLSRLDKKIIDAEKINILKNLVNQGKLDSFNIASSYFLLAEYENKKKNFKNEINLIKKANNYSFKKNQHKNIQLNEYWLKNISKKYNKIDYYKKNDHFDYNNNVYPIFIIGLPRCGSTLIESVISSGKDKIDNMGETNLVNWALLNTNRDFQRSSSKIKVNLNSTSKKLRNAIENLSLKKNKKKIIFSEKSLENFYYIELILNIYPNAKFIHSYRNLVDNTFAIYKQFLPNISWSHTIEDILLYIDNYLTVIDFFQKKYANKILPVSLENFSKNPKKTSKQIYKFCDLRWSESCLNFYKRQDLFINTASNNQMRNKIEKYNYNKYEPYRETLKKYQKTYSWLKF